MTFFKYSRWDGTQEVFPVNPEKLLDQLSDNLMGHGDVSSALRNMLQRGVKGDQGQHVLGIQDLLRRLRDKRVSTMNRYNMDSVMNRIQGQLDEIEKLEREGIEKRLKEIQDRYEERRRQGQPADGTDDNLVQMMKRMAARNKESMDRMPKDPAGRISRLRNYEFMSPEAKAKFDRLLKSLQDKVLDRYFNDLSRQIRGITPRDMANMRKILKDLNRMLEDRAQGGQPNFGRFMEQYGHLFGNNPPSTLDDLVEEMQRQASIVESLLNSMSPSSKRQLQELMSSVFNDPELTGELQRLSANLDNLYPINPPDWNLPFRGTESLSLDQALDVVKDLQGVEELERQLRRGQHSTDLDGVDMQLLQELLGDEAKAEIERLKEVIKSLEEAGYIRNDGGKFELTPKGMRKIGQKALGEIFAYIKKDRSGSHATRRKGSNGELSGETRPYQFGDDLELNIRKSLSNAVMRGSEGFPIRLKAQDLEVNEAEHWSQSSTVLMVDLSLSMAMRGSFQAAKKVAMAMDLLIRTRFPRDDFFVVGFSTYAREIKPESLPYLTWDEYAPYTNIQQGLSLSKRLLSRAGAGTKQIIMISDGEPTAHTEGGQLFLRYPPSPSTVRETLKEVRRCTSRGILINTFMLDRNAYLVDFVDQMTRINQGRVFYTNPQQLGQYVLVDYFTSKRKVVK